MKLVFAGTPAFAGALLEDLITHSAQADRSLQGVLTQPDRPAGRGRQLTASPVKQSAQAAQLPCLQPKTIDQKTLEDIAAWAPDVIIVAAYGLLLPAELLELPTYGCLNVHTSLLPRWRGAAPIQRAIESGDSTTGVTLMRMTPGLDTGPMLATEALTISPEDTAGTLEHKLLSLAKPLLNQYLQALTEAAGQAKPADPAAHPALQALLQGKAQDNTQACYARKLKAAEGALDWSQSAKQLQQKIRAFNPAPGCFTRLNTEREPLRIKIWQASVVSIEPPEHQTAPPGTLLAHPKQPKEHLWVATGAGILALEVMQCPGGKALPVSELLKAKHALFPPGQRFSTVSVGHD